MRNKNKEDIEVMHRYVELLENASGGSMAERMRYALATELTPRQQELVKLYYLDGMSQRTIAQTLELADSTVSRTLLRARNKLRRSLRYGGRNLLSAMEDY